MDALKKTDLEIVREEIKERQKDCKDFDRLRLYIEIKELVRFMEDVYKNTVPVVSNNFMEFFDKEELAELYNRLAPISIKTADIVIDFDKLLGEKREVNKKKIEKSPQGIMVNRSVSEDTFVGDNPKYVV